MARWVGAVLILEHTSQHKDFFTPGMAMGLKHRPRGPAQQGHLLGAVAVQWHHLQPGHQTRPPGLPSWLKGAWLVPAGLRR